MRTRLIVAFVAVTMLGAGVAVWAGVQQASTAFVASSQFQHVSAVVRQITTVAPSVDYPPSQEALERLRLVAGSNSLVVYEDRESGAGQLALGIKAVPEKLRNTVQDPTNPDGGRVFTQRVMMDGRSWLVIGTAVMITEPDGARVHSRVEVYTARDLSDIEAQVAGLIRYAIGTSLLVLPLAAVIALIASRSVLKPVDKLRITARRLADGDLDARTEPVGVDELAQLTRTVNEMASSLQMNMTSMARMEEDAQRFAADVSHELRTPLTTLTAVVEILHDALTRQKDLQVDDEVQESAELAVVETRRLVQLVEEVIEIARFDAGTADMRWEETNLVEVIRNCLRARDWEDDATVELSEGYWDSSGACGTVWGDRRRLDVVIANLIGNALKHGRAPVHISVEVAPDEILVKVIDSGSGIPSNVLPYIFSRFYKGDNARTRSHGSGLGLAIAQENTRLHRGTISAANTRNKGAVFTLRLPTAAPATEDHQI